MTNPFNVLNNDDQKNSIKEFASDDKSLPLAKRIEKILASDKIVLFMKGNAQFPQCGFSANSVEILTSLNKSFTTFNILEDMEIRQGLKEYSNWPTYPQLYIGGKLVGGNDILTELYESGDLAKMV